MNPVKARAMRPGATIGVPAPASPYTNRSELLRGVEWWEKKGYRIKLADGILRIVGQIPERGMTPDKLSF